MKKKLLVLGATMLIGCGIGAQKVGVVHAEEEIMSSSYVEEMSSELESVSSEGEEKGVFKEISQTAYDTIEIIKTFLNQPITIAGVTTTLSAIIIALVTRLVGTAKTSKIKELTNSLTNLVKQVAETQKDNAELAKKCENFEKVLGIIAENEGDTKFKKELVALTYLFANSIKNVEIQEKARELIEQINLSVNSQETKTNAMELLKDLGKVKDHAVDFVETETEMVKEDTKEEINTDANEILNILEKDK